MKLRSGQTLVLLLVFMAMAIIVATAAIAVIITNAEAGAKYQSGLTALTLAESGMEDGLIQLLRNPSYSGGTLTTSDGTATINVTGSNPKSIISSGVSGSYLRKVQVTASFTNGIMTVTSWKEIN